MVQIATLVERIEHVLVPAAHLKDMQSSLMDGKILRGQLQGGVQVFQSLVCGFGLVSAAEGPSTFVIALQGDEVMPAEVGVREAFMSLDFFGGLFRAEEGGA
jgi:hypothetical protein